MVTRFVTSESPMEVTSDLLMDKDTATTLHREMLGMIRDGLNGMINESRLLNARVEEGFNTTITANDIESEG